MSLQDDHPHLKFTLDNEYIHKALLIDQRLAQFLTFLVEFHTLKNNKIECNLRAAHGFVSYSIGRNGKQLSEYPELKACWDGIRNTDAYIDSAKHEQALTFGLEGHVAIKNISVFDHNDMYIKDLVRRRDLYDQNTGCGVRTVNMWELKKKMFLFYQVQKQNEQRYVLKLEKPKHVNHLNHIIFHVNVQLQSMIFSTPNV